MAESESFVSQIPDRERSSLQSDLEEFCVRHASRHRPVALVTSGGTAADLEINSVRCLDNFSTGLRGAVSVEEFLKRGYAVVHLWRTGSASPYGRVLSQALGLPQANHGISMASVGRLFATEDPEEDDDDQIVRSIVNNQGSDPFMSEATTESINGARNSSEGRSSRNTKSADPELCLNRKISNSSRIKSALKERSTIVQEGRILTIPFRSVEEYLGKLQIASEALNDCQSLAIIYLAAAVSDFYVPKNERSEHKMQSTSDDGNGNSGLTLHLKPVPKVMGQLRRTWAPKAFVCSFKLETDQELLHTKAERAVQRYGCHMVVGNLLHTRHDEVWLLAPAEWQSDDDTTDNVSEWPFMKLERPSNTNDPDALEHLLLQNVMEAHFDYISTTALAGGAGIDAVVRAHRELEEKQRQIQREIFWRKARSVAMEWAGVVLGAAISYSVSSALRRRMEGK